jgi:integrase
MGLVVSNQLEQIKGFTQAVDKITLSFDELDTILKTTYEREALENARDWLVIGCYTGQRVSDLLKLSQENIELHDGRQFIVLTQQKTKKRVLIPLYHVVQSILEKRGGAFPYAISDQRFNEYIKEVCKLAGLTEETSGAMMNKETERKTKGTYKKWELVTSHICRRSFATNFYGTIPTPLLKAVTGHSTEAMFLEYIGKSATDNLAYQLDTVWNA